MFKLIVGDLRTGRRIVDVPYLTCRWELNRNAPETLEAKIPLSAKLVRSLDLRNATTPAKTFLGAVVDDRVVAAGPIWRRTYDRDSGSLDLSAQGMWTYFDHRTITPSTAAAEGVIDPDTGESINNTTITASYGQIAKELVQQARLWTGGDVPIVFQDDEAGDYFREYKGANLTSLGDALRNLVELVNGVDIRFLPRFTSDRLGVEWVLQTGTLEQPRLRSPQTHMWDLSVKSPTVKGLRMVDDGTALVSRQWVTAGRQDGIALAEWSDDSTLTDAGYPLLEGVDFSHPDVVLTQTLQDYAVNATDVGKHPTSTIAFKARGNVAPRAGQFLPGDFGMLKVGKDPWIPAGEYTREITRVAGDGSDWLDVTVQWTPDAVDVLRSASRTADDMEPYPGEFWPGYIGPEAEV